MDAIVEEEMGLLSAKERVNMSKSFRRWARQLAMSAKAMEAAKARTRSPINWLGVD